MGTFRQVTRAEAQKLKEIEALANVLTARAKETGIGQPKEKANPNKKNRLEVTQYQAPKK